MSGVGESTRELRIGRFHITALRDLSFALDGGAMFGVVPRAIWESLTPVFDDHTIPLATTPYLVRDEQTCVLIEPGLGLRWDEKSRARFHMDAGDGRELLQSLRAAGYEPEQVDHCLMTHLHWDHIGAAVDIDGHPVFRKARHWTPASEQTAALSGDHLRRASYRREDVQPLLEAGLLQTFEGEREILPGIRMIELGGHSDGVSIVLIEDAGQTACFWSDVVPTRNHVHPPFIMAFDMNAEKSFQVRSRWIARAAEEDWMNLLYHDPVAPIGRFVRQGKRVAFEAL